MADETFQEREATEGVRLAWNVWPNTRSEANKTVVPLCATVEPAKEMGNALPVLPYGPVRCSGCCLALNCHCEVDFAHLLWSCPHCAKRNQMPQLYSGIRPDCLPPELFPQHLAVEYTLAQASHSPQSTPLALAFVLDACLPDSELSNATESIEQVLTLLPSHTAIALITFDKNVCLHALSGPSNGFSRSVLLSGSKDMSGDHIRALLNVGRKAPSHSSAPAHDPSARFVCKYSDCELTLEHVLHSIQPSPHLSKEGHRRERAVGTALNVATSLMEMYSYNRGGRVMLLTGGPPTVGPGKIVDTDRESELRTHHDFEKGNVKHFKNAKQHYDSLAVRLAEQSCGLDVFACSMDQCGVSEMKDAINCTGGTVVLAESFASDNYRRTLNHMFSSELDENDGSEKLRGCYGGQISVLGPKDVRVNGAIGPVSRGTTPKNVGMCSPSDITLGIGETTTWNLPTFREGTTLSVYFDVANSQQSHANGAGSTLLLQFQCTYTTAAGERRMRVMTVPRTWAASSDAEIAAGFDQVAAAVATARHVAFKAENDEPFDIMRWLDRQLIRLCVKYGDYTVDNADSFNLQPNFALFPQFLFNLRRSQFLQVFNNVPDETAYYRLMLCREDCDNTVLMMQPSLQRYSLESPHPEPVLLDAGSVRPDVTLLLDTYFLVLVHYGSHVAAWREAEYHQDPQYVALKHLIEQPHKDAKEIERNRFPTPTMKDVDQHGSQARFLIAKLNPSATHENPESEMEDQTQEYINTDDASFQKFFAHLAHIAVQN
jgi:protein transport protein SEC23